MPEKREWIQHPTPLIDPLRCSGCGQCIEVCPTGALALVGGKARVVQAEACDYTGLCEMTCPMEAIARQFEIVLAPRPE
jgi:ferredoxin